MSEKDFAIVNVLRRLLEETDSDFAGLGLIDDAARKLRWRFTAGSISERTVKITQKPTIGLSGTVIRTGRPLITKSAFTNEEWIRLDEPLVLSEHLRSAAVVPLDMEAVVCGVILFGRRFSRSYSPEELDGAMRGAVELAADIYQLHNSM